MHLRFNVPPQLTCAWLIQTKMYQSLARTLSLSLSVSLPASSKRLLSVSLCMVCGGDKNKKSQYKVEPQPELETSSAFRSLSFSLSFYLFYLSV